LAFVAEQSGNLAGPVPGDRIEVHSISLALGVPTCQIQKFGVPPKWGNVASHMYMVACPTFDLGLKVVVGMHIDMEQVGMGCPCRYIRSYMNIVTC
jgi:hypothetical protein